jgi:hypothetical protein
MSDIRKLLDIISESSAGASTAGSIASVSAPVGETQKRQEESSTPDMPQIIEYGMWENSALTTSSKLKKSRGKSSKVVKSIYGKDTPDSEKSAKKQGVTEGYHNNIMHAWNSGMSDDELIQKFGQGAFNRLKQKYGDGAIPVPDLVGYKPKEPEDKKVRLHRGLEGPGKALKSIIKQQGVAEAAKWRADDLKGKTWRSKDWDDGELGPDTIPIDRSGKDVDDSGDELKARPGAWGGKYKRMTKKGTPTQAELGMQNNLKMRMKQQKKQGGLTGPKGILPEEGVAEGKLGSAAALAGAIALGGAMGYKHATKDPNAEPSVFKNKHQHAFDAGKNLKKKIAGDQKNEGVAEGKLGESDLILNPASISKAVRGLVPHDSDRTDHEIEMAKSDLYQAGKNSVKIYELIKDMSEEQGLEGWVQEKIIKAADYLNTVREYLESNEIGEEKIYWDSDRPAEPWHTIDAIAGRNRNESIDGVGPSTKMFTSEGEVEEGKTGPGLWANIHAKRERIKKGSGERMRKPGSEGAPTAANLKSAQAGTKK